MVEKSSIYDSGPGNKIQIFISCRKLKDTDVFSKSDPQVHVSMREAKQKYQIIGKTEVVSNNLNPDFVTFLTVDYCFEKEQFLKFDVFDVDPVKSDDHIGTCEFTIGQLMAAQK